MGKLNVYNLGEKGVNVDKSPIHLGDDELTKCQNAHWDDDASEGGLRKRPGMTKLNSVAAAGSIQAIANVPLTLPTTYYLWIPETDDNGGNVNNEEWLRLDATAFPSGVPAAGTQLNPPKSVPGHFAGSNGFPTGDNVAANALRFATLRNRVYYPGGATDFASSPTAGTEIPIRVFDGTIDTEIARIPFNPKSAASATGMVTDMLAGPDGYIYLSTTDRGTEPDNRGRVLQLNPNTGALIQIGESFGSGTGEKAGGSPFCLCFYLGFLFVGCYGGGTPATSKVYRIRPGVEKVWTLDHTPDGGCMSMAVYQGQLYLGTYRTSASAEVAQVKVRDPLGAWSQSDPMSGAAAADSHWSALHAYNGNLYAARNVVGGVTDIRKYNGTAWSTAHTMGHLQQPSQWVTVNSIAYMVGRNLTHPRLLRNNADTFTETSDAVIEGYRGPIVALTV